MGAQKVKKDFAEIEREAELADQVQGAFINDFTQNGVGWWLTL